MRNPLLPTEVELVYEVMPCNAMRVGQEPIRDVHPCAYFRKWGSYHSFDYVEDGPTHHPGIELPAKYMGRAPLLPELLSGCRKAPILAVGINPNLPGWLRTKRNSLNPLFDDYRQYAHYFRYRAVAKLEIPMDKYTQFGGGLHDTPNSTFELNVPPNTSGERILPTQLQLQQMYEGYQWLLEEMARLAGWNGHKLALGEDLAYGNMVACPSARWITKIDPKDPAMPSMTVEERTGIVGECFVDRRYFLRQLFQSLPAVLMVFSENTARAFNRIMRERFISDAPLDDEPFDQMVSQRRTVLKYGDSSGIELTARVIYSPHISGTPEEFKRRREHIAGELLHEVKAGRLTLNPATGHIRRQAGSCVFCLMLNIGQCDYEAELRPLADAPQLAAVAGTTPEAEKPVQMALLGETGRDRSAAAAAFAAADQETSDHAFMGKPSLMADGIQDSERAFVAPGLMAGEVDADTGPTFVLQGRIVTMDGDGTVIDNGLVAVSKGIIAAVVRDGQPLPTEFADATRVVTSGTIYPGLIDLHNHFVYNALTLWNVPGKFTNRAQWQGKAEYRRQVSGPMQVLAGISRSSRAIVRFVEAKALIGGTTTGQGMMTRINGKRTLFNGAMRNVEQTGDARLPEAATRVPDVREDQIVDFEKSLTANHAVFYHLCEGIDPGSRGSFELILNNKLLKPSLVGIHALALKPSDYKDMQQVGAKIVWSPLSNLLLYGKTLDLKAIKESGIIVSLGCDWSPSGSKNLLQELKVARLMSSQQGTPFDNEELVRMVTSAAAATVAWSKYLGSIQKGMLADLLVIAGTTGDPYDQLIQAREQDVSLVIVHGNAWYGDKLLVATLSAFSGSLEDIQINGTAKSFDFTAPASGLDGLTFAKAQENLKNAMDDLVEFRRSNTDERGRLMRLGIDAPEEFTLEMDNELELGAEASEPEFMAAIDEAAPSVELDTPYVAKSDLDHLDQQSNLPVELKNELRIAYTR